MTDRPRSHAEELARYWDALNLGQPADPGALDPDEAAFIQLLVSQARRAQIPAGARARAQRALLRQHARYQTTHQNGGTSMTNGIIAAPGPFAPWRPVRLATPAGRSGRVHQALSWGGALTLATVLMVMFFFLYQDQRNNALIPSAQVTPVASPAATPEAGSWPQWGANAAHTRVASGPGPEGDPELLWSRLAEPSSPQVSIDRGAGADGVLYLPSNGGEIVAIEAASGKELWRSSGYGDTVAIDGDGLIVHGHPGSGASGDLARISRADGHVIWTAETGRINATWNPVIADGVGYTPSGSDLIAFDPTTGETLWRLPLAAPASRGASVAGGLVAVADSQGTMYGVKAADGDLVWSYQTDATIIGHATITNGIVSVNANGGAQDAYLALDAATGSLKWRYATPDGATLLTAAVSETTVYLPAQNGMLYALDAETGALQWSFQAGTSSVTSPALAGGVLFFGASDGFLYALDAATGVERWRFQIDAASNSGVVIVDGVLYLSSSADTLYAIAGSTLAAPTSGTPAPHPNAVPADTVSGDPVTFAWAADGDAQHPLLGPGSLAIDAHGQIWVTSKIGSFFIFDLDGNLLETWGEPGSGEGQFAFSDGGMNDIASILFASDGGFYVADTFNSRIQQFDYQRRLVRTWGTNGPGDGQFLAPVGIAFDAQGNLLVADLFRNDVQRFTPDGVFIDKFGGPGSGPGQFSYPGLTAVAPDGSIWVPDVGNNRIQVLDQNGTFRFAFGAAGNGHGGFSGPSQVAFDGNGYVFVTDQGNNLVQVFDLDGHFLYQFGGLGTGDGQFNSPGSIAINHGTTAVIVDWHNNRIQKFKITGPFPAPAAEATPTS